MENQLQEKLQRLTTPELMQENYKIKNSTICKKWLNRIIEMCFNSLPQYGKDSLSLKDMQELFIRILGGYEFIRVSVAISERVKTKEQMFSPSDIVEILEKNDKDPFTNFLENQAKAVIENNRLDSDITNETSQRFIDYVNSIKSGLDVETATNEFFKQ